MGLKSAFNFGMNPKVNTSWAEDEPTPLTPEGNLTLVDDTSKTVERDFLTVTTRNGHYFYLNPLNW